MKRFGKHFAALLCAAVTAVCTCSVQASAAEETTPAGVAFSDLQAEIEKTAENKPYAAYAAAVFSGDETVFAGYYGETNRETHIAASEDSVFEWGSISKLLTWVSVMQLAEAGKIDLNADIRGYLPDGFLRYLQYDDPVTMLHLMNHTAGWCESSCQIFTDNANDLGDLGTVLRNMEAPQVFRPGEVQSYSNYGAALAGYIVECVSGESYTDYVHHHIFEPLGMEHTSIAPDYTDTPWVRERREQMEFYIAAMDGANYDLLPNGHPLTYVIPYPCGSACGTLSDLVKFGQAMADPAAPLFADPKTQERIFAGSMNFGETQNPRCCYGFWTEPRNVMTYWHNGQTAGSYALLDFDPVSGVGMAYMTNTIASSQIAGDIEKIVFGDLNLDDFAGEPSATVDLTGTYCISRSMLSGSTKFFGALSGAVVMKTGEGTYSVAGLYNLKLIGKDIYEMTDPASGEVLAVATVGKLSDGRKTIQTASQEFVQDDLLLVKMALLAVFMLLCVFASMLVIIKFFKLITKKRKPYTGSGWVTLAQVVKVPVIPAAVWLLSMPFGVPKMPAMVFAGLSVLCALICALTICSDFKAMCSKNPDKAKAVRYIFNILFNGFAVFAVIFFEMYKYWCR